jgi:hypothetical protein
MERRTSSQTAVIRGRPALARGGACQPTTIPMRRFLLVHSTKTLHIRMGRHGVQRAPSAPTSSAPSTPPARPRLTSSVDSARARASHNWVS